MTAGCRTYCTVDQWLSEEVPICAGQYIKREGAGADQHTSYLGMGSHNDADEIAIGSRKKGCKL